jgi:hypothetical protein
MPASICANPERLQRRRQITTETAGGADQRGREKPGSPGCPERSARHGASSAANPRLGLLIIIVCIDVVFYGAIAASIRHFL